MTYKSELEKHRVEKDRFFKVNHHSPLPHQLQHNFIGLSYYPIDENYRFEIPLVEYDEIETIELNTSDNRVKHFDKVGYLPFEIDGESSQITVYKSHSGDYFIPFRDKTSGKETYGAGRYIDPQHHGNVFVLDFNLAYNPSCVYDDAYSCPIPPMENWLEITIESGEKNFDKENLISR